MSRPVLAIALASSLALSGLAWGQQREIVLRRDGAQVGAVTEWVDAHLPRLVERYKHLHANPELSLQETETAALVAERLEACGYEVATGVGGTGVVGVLRNGSGATVLIRGDMDALPIVEETGLPYASAVRVERPDGSSVGAMHACGHDVHTTMLIGIGPLLADLRQHWSGTVVLIAQPAEELGLGALQMIDDGLFERFPRPDFCLSLHVKHDMPVGTLGCVSGWAAANVDTVDITIFGKGGHGARPHSAIDPVVAAAHVVVALQTIVSRRVNPIEPAVITVGSIHGGTKHNIIPDEVRLQLTVRSYSEAVRALLLDAIGQVTADTCRTMGCTRPPVVEIDEKEFTPAAYNDPALAAAATALFASLVGAENVLDLPAEMGGEDFGRYARHLGVPGLQYRVGTVSRARWEATRMPGAEPLPSVHSALYYPEPEPTLRLTLESMANLAMGLMAGGR